MDKNERVLTVAIIGAGSRGADSYGKIMNKDPRFKIVSVCDKRQVKLDAVKERFKISDDNLFLDEKDFFAKKRADICIVATQDKDHVRHCIAALKAGYDVLLEKPITDSKEECEKLLGAQKNTEERSLFVMSFVMHKLSWPLLRSSMKARLEN